MPRRIQLAPEFEELCGILFARLPSEEQNSAFCRFVMHYCWVLEQCGLLMSAEPTPQRYRARQLYMKDRHHIEAVLALDPVPPELARPWVDALWSARELLLSLHPQSYCEALFQRGVGRSGFP